MELGKEIEKYHSYKSFAKRIEAPRLVYVRLCLGGKVTTFFLNVTNKW